MVMARCAVSATALPSATRSLYLAAFTGALRPVFLHAAAIAALGSRSHGS